MRSEVTVRVQCRMPERLIQRATLAGARFDAVRRLSAGALAFDCDAASARTLLELCRRFAIPARVTRRRGVSALRLFCKRRATLPVGLAVGLALCALFLGRVWRIDIDLPDAASGSRAALERALEDLGVRPGMSRSVDAALLSRTLLAQLPDFSYVGVRQEGIRLLVEAVPQSPAPELYDVDAARDLVAGRDGIVVRAVARAGELCVSPGDAVRRGQLLIRGEELAGGDGTRPIAALGEVIVRAWVQGEASLPLFEERTRYTGRAAVGTALTAPGFSWTLSAAEDFDSQIAEVECLPIGGLFLPVALERRTLLETRTERVEADRAALEARLSALALADAARRLSALGSEEYEVSDRWVNCRAEGGQLRARAVYEIHTDAAATREELLQGG